LDGELKLQSAPLLSGLASLPMILWKPIADIKDNFRFPTILDNIQHIIEAKKSLKGNSNYRLW
jgi:hypothetical protein